MSYSDGVVKLISGQFSFRTPCEVFERLEIFIRSLTSTIYPPTIL